MNFTGRVGQACWAKACWAEAGTDQRGAVKAADAAADPNRKPRRDFIDYLLLFATSCLFPSRPRAQRVVGRGHRGGGTCNSSPHPGSYRWRDTRRPSPPLSGGRESEARRENQSPFFLSRRARCVWAGLALQPRRHVFILARKVHPGGKRHGFCERGKILLQVALRVLLQHGGAKMTLQHFPRRRRDRHRHVHVAAELESEIEILTQQLRRECRGPVEID